MWLRAVLTALTLAGGLLLPASTPVVTEANVAATTVSGLDLHDGMAYRDGGTYYMVGSMYGCGYQWYVASPWCGFGVSTASSLAGPWTTPRALFPPTEADPLTGKTFAAECGTQDGHGCFNPRMLKRPDGVWVLWFNEVNGRTSSTTSAYWVFGCNGPAGGCGASAGAPYGSTHKPALHQCNGNNGDFALVTDAAGAVLICSYGGTLAQERLDKWWTNGTGTGSTALAGLSNVEGVGAYQDPATGTWIMTYADSACGYCAGTGTGYATADSLMGPWTAPGNVGWSPPANGRRAISATSCGGQPRTISIIDGTAYQGIDLWKGTRNETSAGLLLAPLTYTPTTATPGDGRRWVPPVAYTC
jgi:hypothetical protein